ncbi:MAG: ASPIC/UnbV domain-containing protein [Planctomycetota bacterium]|nr:ASPIC/UnbV domain-containing protein [Planctomycetota bacterium]
MPNSTGDSENQADIERMREQHERFDHELQIGKSFSGKERHCAFLNLGDRSFANVSSVSGLDFIEDGRGLALSDWDLDGDVDFLLTNRNAPMFRYLQNDIESGNHFVSFKLTGKLCNRDAIGARIRVKPSNGDWLTRTVTAGSGFLSQSSKRITFGLGSSDAIEAVEIAWPDGSRNSLKDVAVDQHYLITQSESEPEVAPFARPQPVRLQPGAIPRVESGQVTTYVVPPLRMPITEIKTDDGRSAPVKWAEGDDTKSYTLINLWASWCEPCKVELKEFAEQYDSLQALGVRVIALTTDGLPGQETSLSDAQKVANKLKFPFTWGTAKADWIDKMALLRGAYYDVQQPYPIPTSFLVDSQGQLRMVYQGQVTIDQLRQDIERLTLPAEELRDWITPFAKTWVSGPRSSNDLRLKNLFAKHGYEADAIYFDSFAGPEKARLQYANAVKSITANDFQTASLTLRKAIELDPTYAPAHLNLADIISKAAQQSRGPTVMQAYAQAEQHYRSAIQHGSNEFDAHFGLGFVLARLGRVNDAIAAFDKASERAPDKWESRLAVAKLLGSQGKFADAIQRLQDAVANQPENETLVSELAGLLVHSGQYESSRQLCQSYLQKLPQAAEIQARLGDSYLFGGQPGSALAQYNQLQPTPLLNLKKVWILSNSAEPSNQEKDFLTRFLRQTMPRLQPNDPLSAQVVAAALAQSGDFAAAARLQMSILRLFPAGSSAAQSAQRRLQMYQQGKPSRQLGARDNPFTQSLLQATR